MKVTISSNPLALSGNTRVVEHLNTETGSDRNPVMSFHYEAITYVNAQENAKEIVEFRKQDKLLATNDVKVNASGKIILPNEQGEYPEGVIGERDFYIAALFSGNYTQEQLIRFVVLQADSNKRFD